MTKAGRETAGWRALVWWLTTVRTCAWCGKRLGGSPFARKETHGICLPCRDKMVGGLKK